MENPESSGVGVSPEKENVVDPAEEKQEKGEAPKDEEQTEKKEEKEEEKGKEDEKTEEMEGKEGEEERKTEEQDDEKEEDEADDEEEESEGRAALFDEPLVVDGKRRRSTVDHFAVTSSAQRPKQSVYQGGQGVHLGSIDFIKDQIHKHQAVTLKKMHRVLYGRVGKVTVIKKEIREFNGFAFAKDDEEYKKRLGMIRKMTLPDIRYIKQILGLHQTVDMGTNKDAMIDMLFTFLLKPEDHNRKVPQKRKAPKDSKKDTPTRKPRAKRAKKQKDDEDEQSEKEADYQSDGASEDDVANKSTNSDKKVHFAEDEESPTTAQLEDACKEFIGTVDLTKVTMKEMLASIADKFPDDDLAPRKSQMKDIIRRLVASS